MLSAVQDRNDFGVVLPAAGKFLHRGLPHGPMVIGLRAVQKRRP